MKPISHADIERRFGRSVVYQGTDADVSLTSLSSNFHVFAEDLLEDLPEGREKSLALTALEESYLWAAEAIMREGD